jgi:hypothetical protein
MNIEHRTFNVQRRMKNEYQYRRAAQALAPRDIQQLFLFLFSRFDTRNENLN